jgi:carbon-monoxide dehydrogenase small subunit
MIRISFDVNGKNQTIESHPMARLLDVLREESGLTGTKEGCGEGECGACSVLINGELVNSCLVPAIQAQGASIRTIEGIASGDKLHAVQQAFLETGGAQCGICTPGMIMASVSLVESGKKTNQITDEEIRQALAGNLCRCTGYMKIFDAVRKACDVLGDSGASESPGSTG